MALLSCGARKPVEIAPAGALRADFETLRGKRIFFGHQSVGADVIDGMRRLAAEVGAPAPRFLSPEAASSSPGGFFADAAVGRNTDPASKCEDFAARVDRLASSLDIALLKFCYVDFNESTDPAAVFDRYRRTLRELEARHPNVVFVPVTAPLTAPRASWKNTVKGWLGRPGEDTLANLARSRFNDMVRREWSGNAIFDLAAAESSWSGGARNEFRFAGQAGYALIPDYTTDGGHLNAAGKRIAAAEMVAALARAASRPPAASRP